MNSDPRSAPPDREPGTTDDTPPRRPRWFLTLKARLMAASALLMAASVAVSTHVVLQRVQQRSETAVMNLERDTAERLASLLAHRVVTMQRMLRAAADGLPPAARTDPAAAVDYLADKPGLSVTFATLYIVDAGGQVLALHDGTRATRSDIRIGEHDYFRQAVAGAMPIVSRPMQGLVANEPAIQFLMPLPPAAAAPAAVIGASLRLASRNLFDDLTYAGHGSQADALTIITDARGIIISHPRHRAVMQPIATQPGLQPLLARWAAQGRPIEPSGVTTHDGGRFISMAGVPGADWLVFRITPDAQLLGGLAQARHEAVLWAGGVALLGSVLILALLAWLLGPLSRLRRRALDLQNVDRPIDEGWPVASGEIGELSAALQRVLRERALGEADRHALVQRMSSVLAAAPIGIGFTRERRFELVGAEFCTLLGWSRSELLGRPTHEIFPSADDYDALGEAVREAFSTGLPYVGELPVMRRDRSSFWGRLQGRPVDPADANAGTIWLLEDVTERRDAGQRLAWSANHDALTRLLNRAAFEARLVDWLAQPGRGMPAALLFIDLDHFKQVNDTAGHAAGDQVLRDVASVLQDRLRGGDALARIGGDEFALLLPGCVGAVANQLGERLRSAVARVGIDHGGLRLGVDASIGVVEIDAQAGLDAQAWLARADAECYRAKREGRGVVCLA